MKEDSDRWGDDYAYATEAPAAAPTRLPASDPNSPEELARLNKIYGPDGTVYHKPADNSTWNSKTESWDTPAATTTTGGDNWDAARVADYFKSRGVTPNASSPDYWAQKWNEWGKNDPAYFMQRLAQADEFTGGPAATGGAPANGPSQPSNFQPGQFQSTFSPPPGINTELYNLLLTRAKEGTAVNADDPNIRQQVDPYAAQVERDRRNYLADTAERRGPLANIQGETRVSAEHAGQAKGLFQSTLIAKEITARRDEIQQALTQLGNQLNADQSRALQQELAYLNAAATKYGIDVSAQTSRYNTDTNAQLGRDRLGLDYTAQDWLMDPRNPANLPR